jgi:hypothetical protein
VNALADLSRADAPVAWRRICTDMRLLPRGRLHRIAPGFPQAAVLRLPRHRAVPMAEPLNRLAESDAQASPVRSRRPKPTARFVPFP